MGFSLLDYIIVGVYLVGVALIGIRTGGKQSSASDYFLGGKSIPWWAVCFAIVATETSTLTFISIPGLAYLTNLNFLQVTIGYLLGRIVVSFLFLPHYFKGDLQTAYSFLNSRFGAKTRNLASVTFMFTRLIGDGVRLFATAIPVAILFKGWQIFTDVPNEYLYIVSIVIMAMMTLAYVFIGGVRAVIWTDVIQMVIYLLGAIAALFVLTTKLPGGLTNVMTQAISSGKLSIFSSGFDKSIGDFFATPYTLVASLLGGAFLSMASHGTDQLIVQRLLTVNSLKGSQKALIGSGIIVIIQFIVFMLVGVLLYQFYGGASLSSMGLLKADELFPKFIIEQIPTGISGLIIAGLLAAAMSTLSGSVNSLAHATMSDIYKPYFGKNNSEVRDLKISRMFTLLWAFLLIAMAIFFIYNQSKALVEVALSVASFTYGGLLGLFLLGVLSKKANQASAIAGFISGVLVMILVVTFAKVGWTWYTLIGSSVTVGIGIITSFVRSKSNHTSSTI